MTEWDDHSDHESWTSKFVNGSRDTDIVGSQINNTVSTVKIITEEHGSYYILLTSIYMATALGKWDDGSARYSLVCARGPEISYSAVKQHFVQRSSLHCYPCTLLIPSAQRTAVILTAVPRTAHAGRVILTFLPPPGPIFLKTPR
jgi:hypothetical protein